MRRREVHLIVNQDAPRCRKDKERLKQALETVSIVGTCGDSEWEVVAILFFPHSLQPNGSNRLGFGIGTPGKYQDQAHIEPMIEVGQALMFANDRFLLRPELIDRVIAAANAWLAELPVSHR